MWPVKLKPTHERTRQIPCWTLSVNKSMTIDSATQAAVLQLSTNTQKAHTLLEELDNLKESDKVTTYGLNTRTNEIEITRDTIDLTLIDTDTEPKDTAIHSIVARFEQIGVPVRVMTQPPEAIVKSLSEYVSADVQQGWYEGEEWCCAARDYIHAIQYLEGEIPAIIEEYQDSC